MTHKIQISKRLPDGTILVLGGDTVDEFREIVDGMTNMEDGEHILSLFRGFGEWDIEVPVNDTRRLRLGETRPKARREGMTPEW